MSVFEKTIKDLQGLYPDLILDASGKSAKKPVTTKLDLVIYEDKQPPEWEAVDKETEEVTLVKDVAGAPKLIILEFVSVFNEFKGEAVKNATIEPVKAPEEPENKAEEVIQEPPSDADRRAMLDEIMDGKVEPVKHVPNKALAARERAISKAPATIPLDIRNMQIQELTFEDIKNYVCPDATDSEAFMFLKLCQARNLNPFIGEAYLIKYGNDKAQMVVGKETFTRRAEVNPHIRGWKAGIIIRVKAEKDKSAGPIERREGAFILPEEELLGGWAKIFRDDIEEPHLYEVTLQEYLGRKRDGQITKMWREKPCTMIRKDALVGGLREAAPSEFSGMYDQAEIEGGIIEANFEELALRGK